MSDLEERIARRNAKETEEAKAIWDTTGYQVGQSVEIKKKGHTYNGRVGTIVDYTVWHGKVVQVKVDITETITHCKLSSIKRI